jgi:hypothetical protein
VRSGGGGGGGGGGGSGSSSVADTMTQWARVIVSDISDMQAVRVLQPQG